MAKDRHEWEKAMEFEGTKEVDTRGKGNDKGRKEGEEKGRKRKVRWRGKWNIGQTERQSDRYTMTQRQSVCDHN